MVSLWTHLSFSLHEDARIELDHVLDKHRLEWRRGRGGGGEREGRRGERRGRRGGEGEGTTDESKTVCMTVCLFIYRKKSKVP